nr:immunoglobulin heavy chain junction region [Macaca mulatta]MOY18005.1 immunoglobulin heavy chain junction region [Macaca mulatta]MOY18079.1 immunoglobulin heavy chain junction region [Macaca mulatta]MOY18253.1 immunoglobulin heavy chain junction region [Macaca mulatta]MOY18264.1 immunoglobulin heavy chain junction region [Macaca mulatta]
CVSGYYEDDYDYYYPFDYW